MYYTYKIQAYYCIINQHKCKINNTIIKKMQQNDCQLKSIRFMFSKEWTKMIRQLIVN